MFTDLIMNIDQHCAQIWLVKKWLVADVNRFSTNVSSKHLEDDLVSLTQSRCIFSCLPIQLTWCLFSKFGLSGIIPRLQGNGIQYHSFVSPFRFGLFQ